MYLFSYSVHGMCKDYPACDIAYNAVMPLSHAPTCGRYSRIVGVTHYILGNPINVETNVIETVTLEEYIRDTFRDVSDSEKE